MRKFLEEERKKSYFQQLEAFVKEERRLFKVYPKEEQVFRAFDMSVGQVRVVIMGQDPYHGEGQADGLAFSVPYGVKLPPSLKNIYKEMAEDLGGHIPSSGDLSYLERQGVLLLNTTLTVRSGEPLSHKGKGYEVLTDRALSYISKEAQGVVFLLWGHEAIKKASLIDQKRHFILTSVHPSPLSAYRGFLGCRHFSETNRLLKEPISWLEFDPCKNA